ncbi:MAG: hypothetical protein ACLFUJ_06565 [Phycisphaerae bacterium]
MHELTCPIDAIGPKRVLACWATDRENLNQLVWPMVGLAGGLLAIFESTPTAVAWMTCLGGLLAMLRSLSGPLKLPREVYPFAALSMLVLTGFGMALALNYRSMWGFDFGPNFDDSLYFFRISQLAAGADLEAFTSFEWVMGGWYCLLSLAFGRVEHIQLLSMNWAMGAAVAAMAWQLPRSLLSLRCPGWLAILAVLCHVSYIDSVGHLYRDGLMLLFMMISLQLASQRHYLWALLPAAGCATVRAANGIIVVLAIFLLAVSRSRWIHKPGGLFIATVCLLGSLAVADQTIKLGSQLRSLQPGPSGGESVTIIERALARGPLMLSQTPGSVDDAQRVAFQIGPAGHLLRPALTLFAPFKMADPRLELTVHHRGVRKFHVDGSLNLLRMTWLNVPIWLITGPVLILGMVRAWRFSPEARVLLIVFLITLGGLTYVSFQPRHNSALVVLFPCMMALGWQDDRPAAIRARRVLAGLFLVGITLRNALVLVTGDLG